jgi:RimJ/RimL family protein N-acetyltransferase
MSKAISKQTILMEFWRKSYAFEAWSLLLEYAFEALGLRKIIAGAVVDNVPSMAVLDKLGFQVEGTLRQEFVMNGECRDAVRFGLLKHEFYKDLRPGNRESL